MHKEEITEEASKRKGKGGEKGENVYVINEFQDSVASQSSLFGEFLFGEPPWSFKSILP